MTRIAILTPGFAADEAETNCVPAIQDFLIALKERRPDFRPTVFSLRYPHRRAHYTWHGIDVFAANGQQLRFPFVLASWSRVARDFIRVNKLQPIQIIHSFWLGECAFIGSFLSRAFSIPHVITLMGQEFRQHNRYARLIGSRSAVSVAVSEFQRRHVMRQSAYDVQHVIPWGLPDLKVNPGDVRSIDVLGVGSLTDVKDIATFLDVIAIVRARRTIRCSIIGEGPNRSALESRAKMLGIDDVVTFEGWLSRERVMALMSKSRVLLHTSKFESFGLALVEARACGASVVSRPVGIAEAGRAWALADDAATMADAVLRFLCEPPAPEPVVHSVERTVAAYADLYAQLAGRSSAARNVAS